MKKKILVGMLTTVLLLLTVGLSYSYFTGKVNGGDKELLISSKNVRILFTDSREIANDGIKPGWNDSKTFSVKNESNDNFNYNIVFENLVNTFVTEGFLQYKITSSSGYNMTGYLDIPKSSTPKTVVLAYDIDLPVDTTHEYTIEFVYHDSETVDQSDDMGKIFEGNLAIIEGSANPDIKYTVTMNSDNGVITPTSNQAIKYENLEFEVTPNTGYDVSTMSVSCDPVANTVITGNKIKVNDIRQDHNCEVSFDKETYTVNIVVNNGKSDALNKVVEYGESGTTTITPNYGYTVENATVEGIGCSIENGILTISNVTSNGTCTVTLPRDTYTVTLTGTGIASSNSPQEAEYEGNTSINFTLANGYELGSNVVNCDNNATPSISGNVLTVSNVTANTTCTISPVLKSYDVTLKVVGGTPTSETKSINHNESGTYTIAKSTGYKLELNGSISCTGNAVGSLSGSTVTISRVTATQTCTVTLKKETRTVNITKTGSGTVSPSSTTVNYGDNLTVSVTPSTGYRYSSNTCGLTVSNNKMTFSNIISNISCSVTFTQITYTAKVNVTNGKVGNSTTASKSVAYNGSTTFTITPDSGYTLKDSTVSPTSGCSLDTSTGVLTMSAMLGDRTCNVTVAKIKTLAETIKASYPPKSGRTNFSDIDNGTPALYTGEDDQGTTYYFSGNGTNMNNWVSFAGKMWRIIRINGNGSVRLLYAGNGTDATDIGNSGFDGSPSNPMYAGWKYGTSGSLKSNRTNENKSSPYVVVEEWYNTLTTTEKKYLDEYAIYCNDRSIISGSYSTSSTFYYAAYTRLSASSPSPTFYCEDLNDRFTGSNSMPVGLMTADEIVFSGGKIGKWNHNAYYNLAKDGTSRIMGTEFWYTMSPSGFAKADPTLSGSYDSVAIFAMWDHADSSSPKGLSPRIGSLKLRPVISLKSNVLVTEGNGTGDNPYKVTLTEDKTLAGTIKEKYPPQAERTDFSVIDNGTPRLYTGEDDQGKTYYFSGNGTNMNNWVSFAGKLWRIIRINGNGSVRLLYAGTGGEDGYLKPTDISNSEEVEMNANGGVLYNSLNNHPQYVGWKYKAGDSLALNRYNYTMSRAYNTVNNWYTINIKNAGLVDFIDTKTIYCNDRELASGYSYSTNSKFFYAARERFIDKNIPTFKCKESKDRFENFGLMTADEAIYGGGLFNVSNDKAYYYLNKNGGSATGSEYWWSMTPLMFDGEKSSMAIMGGSTRPGQVVVIAADNKTFIRPVISLKPQVLVTGGNGSGSSPYTLTIQ